MSSHPEELEFYIGGFMGMSYRVTYSDSVLTYRQSNCVDVLGNQFVEPSDQEWMEFRRSVDSSGVWNWNQTYPNPGVCDGTILQGDEQSAWRLGDTMTSIFQFSKSCR